MSKVKQYGDYVIVEGELTKEKLAKAKEEVLENVFTCMKEIAKEDDEIFIIKDLPDGTGKTVGFKFAVDIIS